MRLPKAIQRLIEQFEKLPGVGPKTAQRLVFYLLHNPQTELDGFADAFTRLKKDTQICSECNNVGETDPCEVCSSSDREESVICVVEQPLDVLVVERSGGYDGLYHVLHGSISPLNNIGPEQLHLYDLLPRLKDDRIRELILATNPTMEGEATAMYISKLVTDKKLDIKITRIGRGLPVGGDLEYADDITLSRAFEGRREV
ncbi:recombination mediator RecR [Patescibacteria group bacterium]